MVDEAVGAVTVPCGLAELDGEQLVSAIGMAASTATSPHRAILEDDGIGASMADPWRAGDHFVNLR
jgi:hypothetical protein